MKPFVVYDPATGKILRSGICQDKNVGMQARDGEAAMEGSGSDLLHEIDLDAGTVVERSTPLPLPIPKPVPAPPSDEDIDTAVTIDDIKVLLKRVIKSR